MDNQKNTKRRSVFPHYCDFNVNNYKRMVCPSHGPSLDLCLLKTRDINIDQIELEQHTYLTKGSFSIPFLLFSVLGTPEVTDLIISSCEYRLHPP